MHQPLRFADDIEPLVRFVEETEPKRLLEETLAKLRGGLPIKTMLTASALAVTRSSDLPPGHHGGPLHPLVGIHAIRHTVERVAGDDRFLPVLQHVGLSNKHINHPGMGPYILADHAPVDAGGVEATKKAFFAAIDRGLYNAADHHFLWLWQHVPPVEAFDLLLTVAIPKNTLDDHYFVFPMFTWRALEWLGAEYLPVLMRPAVRYVSRFPTPPAVAPIDALIEEHRLLDRELRARTGADETAVIGSLDGISMKNKLRALLLWHTGPEVRSTQNRMEPTPQPDPASVAALPSRSQAELIAAIAESIHTQPPTDWSKVTNLGLMRAVPEVKDTLALAQQYANLEYDSTALIRRLAEIACHDNFTEMHALKHHQATFEEFHATRHPWRWRHLVSAAQASAISYGKNMELYEEAIELLHA